MGELTNAKFNLDNTPYYEPQLIRAVSWADILIPTVTDQVNVKIINSAGPNLKLIANFGVGVNHIDLEPAEAKGIQVSNTPDVLTEDTADLAMGSFIMGFSTFWRIRAYGKSRRLDRLDAYSVDGRARVAGLRLQVLMYLTVNLTLTRSLWI